MKRSVFLLCAAFGVVVTVAVAGDSVKDEYAKRAAEVQANAADAHYRLALWCGEHGLPAAYANRHYRAVVTLETDHRAARRALGYERVAGRWVKGKDLMRAKGFVEHDGAWVTRKEYELYARDEIEAQNARTSRKTGNDALKQAWDKDPKVRARAMATIESIDSRHRLRPLAIAARINRPDVRLRAVAGLGALNRSEALPPLYKRAVFDRDESIRMAAVQAIKRSEIKGKSDPFIRALNSPFDSVRLHAVKALGELGDMKAVGPLVARYQVVGGSGQSVYISQVNQISYVQDFDVEVAQTAFIADPVIGVIQDGLTLHFRALATTGTIDVYERPAFAEALTSLTGKDFGTDAKAWLKWYRNEQREKLQRSKARRAREREREREEDESEGGSEAGNG